jgi:hypothetical protein
MLARSPVFSVFAIASLTLGVGAAAATFSLLDAIAWRQLPVREPGRLVAVFILHPRAGANSWLLFPSSRRCAIAARTSNDEVRGAPAAAEPNLRRRFQVERRALSRAF